MFYTQAVAVNINKLFGQYYFVIITTFMFIKDIYFVDTNYSVSIPWNMQ